GRLPRGRFRPARRRLRAVRPDRESAAHAAGDDRNQADVERGLSADRAQTSSMRSISVQIDERTYSALNRIAPAAKRKRAEFIRTAVRRAIREFENERIRQRYLKHPDSDFVVDDWQNAEEWKL